MSEDQFIQIASLDKTLCFNNLKIRARVIAKSPLRPWKWGDVTGRLFNIDLMDGSGKIRAVMYNDKYYEMIQCRNVYIFSNFYLQHANKKYNKLKHAYEMTFEDAGEVCLCEDERDIVALPELRDNYVRLSLIPFKNDSDDVDIIGICLDIGHISICRQKTSDTGKREKKKRDVLLIDATECMVTLTLWNDHVDQIEFHHHYMVISMRRGYVKEYNDSKTIQTSYESVIEINPNVLACQTLRNWFDNCDQDRIKSAMATRNWVTLQEAGSQRLEYFETVGLVYIVDSFQPFYKACTQDGCQAAVESVESGYYCHKCDQTIPDFKYRLRLEIRIADRTHKRTAICFNDSAEQLFRCKAPDVAAAMSEDPVRSKEFFKDVLYKPYVFTVRVDYTDPYRKLILLKSQRLCRRHYNKYLCSKIERYFGSY